MGLGSGCAADNSGAFLPPAQVLFFLRPETGRGKAREAARSTRSRNDSWKSPPGASPTFPAGCAPRPNPPLLPYVVNGIVDFPDYFLAPCTPDPASNGHPPGGSQFRDGKRYRFPIIAEDRLAHLPAPLVVVT